MKKRQSFLLIAFVIIPILFACNGNKNCEVIEEAIPGTYDAKFYFQGQLVSSENSVRFNNNGTFEDNGFLLNAYTENPDSMQVSPKQWRVKEDTLILFHEVENTIGFTEIKMEVLRYSCTELVINELFLGGQVRMSE